MPEKRLEDMSLDELWALFPIVLSHHREEWGQWAAEEINILRSILSSCSPMISHIGSTAIPGIMAKPIVDILVEMPEAIDYGQVRCMMESRGYICMAAGAERMSFNKGYTPSGYAERVFHIHIHREGDNDEIRFRDFLLSHPLEAKAYERLKLSLLPRFRHDRDAYTSAKTLFITNALRSVW